MPHNRLDASEFALRLVDKLEREQLAAIVDEWLGGREIADAIVPYYRGFSYRELAAQTGLPRATLNDRLRQATAKLDRMGVPLGRADRRSAL